MYKIILFIFIIIFYIYNKPTIETIVLSCCGGMKNIDPSDPDPPEKIKRCVKNWNTPCTHKGSGDCCEGIDRCIPSHRGGKCKKRDGSGFYTYDDGEMKDYDKTRDDNIEYDVIYDDEYKNKRSYWSGDEGNIGLWVSPNKYLTYFNYFILLLIILTIIYIIFGSFFSDTDTDYRTSGSNYKYKYTAPSRSDYSYKRYGNDTGRGYETGRVYETGRGYGRRGRYDY